LNTQTLVLYPFLLLLRLVQGKVIVAMYEVCHNNPFSDLGAMGARCCAEWDVRVLVYWMLGEVIGSGGEALDEASFVDIGGCRRKPAECGDYVGPLLEFCVSKVRNVTNQRKEKFAT
jgi:hypothetical protein